MVVVGLMVKYFVLVSLNDLYHSVLVIHIYYIYFHCKHRTCSL